MDFKKRLIVVFSSEEENILKKLELMQPDGVIKTNCVVMVDSSSDQPVLLAKPMKIPPQSEKEILTLVKLDACTMYETFLDTILAFADNAGIPREEILNTVITRLQEDFKNLPNASISDGFMKIPKKQGVIPHFGKAGIA
jgi:hypothetical protein